jgi:hypothetical protein
MELSSLVKEPKARATAILARLPTYFKPKTVLVVAEDEGKEFFFTISFMFMDSTIYVLSPEDIPLDQFEHQGSYKRVSSAKGLEDFDLMIVSSKNLDDAAAKRLGVVAKNHKVGKILIVTESERVVNEAFYLYTIHKSTELIEKYYPLSETVFLLEK